MVTTQNNRDSIFLGMVVLGICLIVCAFIVRSTLIQVKGFSRTIQVTGAAIKQITSDFAVWEGNLNSSAMSLDVAYTKIKSDLTKTIAFLNGQGFEQSVVEIGSVQVNRMYDREGQPGGYTLTQQVRVQMADVPRITQLSQQASSLIEQGVELSSYPPRYLYTRLEEVKIEMIREATENAKLRAQQLAEVTGRDVGAPTSARVGVFQIRPLRSQEVSDYGINDMSSIEKEIVSTVNISFGID